MEKELDELIDFVRSYNHISISDLDDILERLHDMECLSHKGKEFKSCLWKVFIKEKNI